jgi:beta-lactam-binding protein with PASTA domain
VRRGRSIKRRIGKVIGQVPKAGARRPAGTHVHVVIGRK